MPITSAQFDEHSSLISILLDTFASSHRVKAILPSGRREEIVRLLTRLMADPESLMGYTVALKEERRRRGDDLEFRLLTLDGVDIPGDRIAAEGFANLSDDELADFALSPEALLAIREHLDQVLCGAWLIEEILRVESERPDAEEQGRRAIEIYEYLNDTNSLDHAHKIKTSPMSQVPPVFIWIAHPIRRFPMHRGPSSDGSSFPTGELEWVCTSSEMHKDIPLPSEYAVRCYNVLVQEISVRLICEPVPTVPRSFEPQLEVSPPPVQAPLRVTITFADGQSRSLTIPVSRGGSRAAWSEACEPLSATAFGSGEWALRVEFS